MLAPAAAAFYAVSAVAVGFVGHHFLKPRLPVYDIQVATLPTLAYVQGQFQTKLTANIFMHNDNYMEIDVYHLVFDLFYFEQQSKTNAAAFNNNKLIHIGQVQDKHLASQVLTADQPDRTVSWNKPKHVPIWQILPRSNFTIRETLYQSTFTMPLLSTLSTLARNWWQGSGTILLPTTGVAFVKAGLPGNHTTVLPLNNQSRTPMMVSILCDNQVNTLTLQILGVHCVLHNAVPGWSRSVEQPLQKLQQFALSQLRVNSTGGLVFHSKSTIKALELMEAQQESSATSSTYGILYVTFFCLLLLLAFAMHHQKIFLLFTTATTTEEEKEQKETVKDDAVVNDTTTNTNPDTKTTTPPKGAAGAADEAAGAHVNGDANHDEQVDTSLPCPSPTSVVAN